MGTDVLKAAPLLVGILPDDKVLPCPKICHCNEQRVESRNAEPVPDVLKGNRRKGRNTGATLVEGQSTVGDSPSSLVANGFCGFRSSTTARGYQCFVQTKGSSCMEGSLLVSLCNLIGSDFLSLATNAEHADSYLSP